MSEAFFEITFSTRSEETLSLSSRESFETIAPFAETSMKVGAGPCIDETLLMGLGFCAVFKVHGGVERPFTWSVVMDFRRLLLAFELLEDLEAESNTEKEQEDRSEVIIQSRLKNRKANT